MQTLDGLLEVCGLCRHWIGILRFVGCVDICWVYCGLWVVQTLDGFLEVCGLCKHWMVLLRFVGCADIEWVY